MTTSNTVNLSSILINNQNNQPQQYAPQQYQQPVEAPAPVVQQGFYYYPDANVYFDPSCNRYIYNNDGAWLSVNVLPRGFYLGGARYMVYHRGPQVWLDNPIHIRNYYRGGYRPAFAYAGGYRYNNYRGFAARNNFRGGYDYGRGYRRF